jgi:hypothetical protein
MQYVILKYDDYAENERQVSFTEWISFVTGTFKCHKKVMAFL